MYQLTVGRAAKRAGALLDAWQLSLEHALDALNTVFRVKRGFYPSWTPMSQARSVHSEPSQSLVGSD